MTHTLHRRGSKSDLAHDYVVLAMAARGVNRDGAAPKLARALEIFAAHNPVNFRKFLHADAARNGLSYA